MLGHLLSGPEADGPHPSAVVQVVLAQVAPAAQLALRQIRDPAPLLERSAQDPDRLAGATRPSPLGDLVPDQGKVGAERVRGRPVTPVARVAPVDSERAGVPVVLLVFSPRSSSNSPAGPAPSSAQPHSAALHVGVAKPGAEDLPRHNHVTLLAEGRPAQALDRTAQRMEAPGGCFRQAPAPRIAQSHATIEPRLRLMKNGPYGRAIPLPTR